MRTSIGLFCTLSVIAAAPANAYWIRDCHASKANWSGQTTLVSDLRPGPEGSASSVFGFAPRDGLMTAFNGAMYYQADNGQSGAELWRVGNGAPTLVKDIASGAADSSPHAFATFQGKLYFAAGTAATGEALFRYDGATVSLAADVAAGNDDAEISALTVYAGKLYFIRTTDNGQRMWRFDGNSAAPVAAIDAIPGRIDDGDLIARPLVVFKDRLYFIKAQGAAYRLWAYDGAVASSIKMLVEPGNTTSYKFGLGAYNNALHFGAVVPGEAPFHQDELWKYGGTGAPVKVATLDGNADSSSQPNHFQVFQDKLHFSAGGDVYRYNGTTLEDLQAGPGGPPWHARHLTLYSSAGQLYFAGFYDDWRNNEPYLFDGITSTLVRDIMPNDALPYAGSFPSPAVEAGGALYFYASDATHGRELWRVTSDTAVTTLVCDVVVAPLWDDWRRWIENEREVIVSTWLVAPGLRTQLLARERTTAVRGEDIRVRVLDIDTRRKPLPADAALVTVVHDVATGDVLDQGHELIGQGGARARARLQSEIAPLASRTLRQVMAERIRTF